VTFGSMADVVNTDLKELVTNVCQLTNTRAVVQGAVPSGQISDCVFSTGYVPHDWLFRHAACVVLHCGAGTAAAVFRAGVPGVFVPHMGDQMFWAQIACEMGCAKEPLRLFELSARGLAAAIQTTLQNESICSRAAELGRKIRSENGTHKAWQMVDDLVDRIGLRG